MPGGFQGTIGSCDGILIVDRCAIRGGALRIESAEAVAARRTVTKENRTLMTTDLQKIPYTIIKHQLSEKQKLSSYFITRDVFFLI